MWCRWHVSVWCRVRCVVAACRAVLRAILLGCVAGGLACHVVHGLDAEGEGAGGRPHARRDRGTIAGANGQAPARACSASLATLLRAGLWLFVVAAPLHALGRSLPGLHPCLHNSQLYPNSTPAQTQLNPNTTPTQTHNLPPQPNVEPRLTPLPPAQEVEALSAVGPSSAPSFALQVRSLRADALLGTLCGGLSRLRRGPLCSRPPLEAHALLLPS